MKKLNFIISWIVIGFIIVLPLRLDVFAEDSPPQAKPAVIETQEAVVDSLAKSQNVTLDFKDADIRNVLKIISYKAGVNIVTTPEVVGDVTIRLVDVPWEKALDVILRTYGFAYERTGNIITVAPTDKLTTLKKQEVELSEVQPTLTEVFNLRYIDALDAKKALEPQLSPRGKITVLEMTGQAGWDFSAITKGESSTATRERKSTQAAGRSKILIISDVPPVLDKIREVVEKIDLKPKQVLIEAKFIEVNDNFLMDLGMEWGTGSAGVDTTSVTPISIRKNASGSSLTNLGAQALGGYVGNVTPAYFSPLETALNPTNAGLKMVFKKLSGNSMEVILHALEEDANTNTLSAPSILALNNQEASILVGTKYPILTSTAAQATTTVSTSLDYYQDIGIQLNVVPQIGDNDFINMVIHPAISSFSTTTTATGVSAAYPIIEIREAETRLLMKDGDTIVIGGLMKDVKKKENIGIPFLSKIPWLKWLFSRDTTDTEKIDLLIFITATIVKDGLTKQELAVLEKRLDRAPPQDIQAGKKKKKNYKGSNQ